jgi:hypothetical protein
MNPNDWDHHFRPRVRNRTVTLRELWLLRAIVLCILVVAGLLYCMGW